MYSLVCMQGGFSLDLVHSELYGNCTAAIDRKTTP